MLAAATLLAGSVASPLLAQNSPVGSWDFVLSGPQRGLLQLTFNNDFSLDGIEIITERPHTNHRPDEEDVRTPGGDGRGFDDTVSTVSHLIGGNDISGSWTYDSKGHVIGTFTELSNNMTNGVSFTASVRPNVRINMVGHRFSNGRRINYRGVPLTPVPDLSGNFYASGTRDGKPFTELLTLTPGSGTWFPLGANANNYDLVGAGPGYDTMGFVIVSPQKQIAVYSLSSESTNGLLRTITGAYNPTTGDAKTLVGLSKDPDPTKTAPLNVRTSFIKQ